MPSETAGRIVRTVRTGSMTSPTSLEQKNDCSDRRQFVVRWSAVCIEHPLMVVNRTRDPVRVFSTCLNRETTHSLGFLCRVTSSSTELISSAVRDGRSSRALRAPRVKLRSQGTYLHIGHLATDRSCRASSLAEACAAVVAASDRPASPRLFGFQFATIVPIYEPQSNR
jgi:hypothetical protein